MYLKIKPKKGGVRLFPSKKVRPKKKKFKKNLANNVRSLEKFFKYEYSGWKRFFRDEMKIIVNFIKHQLLLEKIRIAKPKKEAEKHVKRTKLINYAKKVHDGFKKHGKKIKDGMKNAIKRPEERKAKPTKKTAEIKEKMADVSKAEPSKMYAKFIPRLFQPKKISMEKFPAFRERLIVIPKEELQETANLAKMYKISEDSLRRIYAKISELKSQVPEGVETVRVVEPLRRSMETLEIMARLQNLDAIPEIKNKLDDIRHRIFQLSADATPKPSDRLTELNGIIEQLKRERDQIKKAKEKIETLYYKREIDQDTFTKFMQEYEKKLIESDVKMEDCQDELRGLEKTGKETTRIEKKSTAGKTLVAAGMLEEKTKGERERAPSFGLPKETPAPPALPIKYYPSKPTEEGKFSEKPGRILEMEKHAPLPGISAEEAKHLEEVTAASWKLKKSKFFFIGSLKKFEVPGTLKKKKPTELVKKELRTNIDNLLDLVNSQGVVKFSEVGKKFNLPHELVEEWAKILEEHYLVELHYPPFREPELRKIKGVAT